MKGKQKAENRKQKKAEKKQKTESRNEKEQTMPRFKGDLPERSYQFALAVIGLCDELPNEMTGWVIGKQLLRSGTSIGANIREADVALTAKEFTQFCNIARREANESWYWLSLCRDCQLLRGDAVAAAIAECEELARVLATVVRKSREQSAS